MKRFNLIALSILVAFGILLPLLLNPAKESAAFEVDTQTERDSLPNVLLITVDGFNATSASAYGFEENTTPFLKELAPTTLFAENAFANAQGTVGAISSILTGKYPVDLRVLYSNDVLKGTDATQNLPGLLKNYGYHTVQLSYSTYTDAFTHNLQGAFDEASGRSYSSGGWLLEKIGSLFSTNIKIFLREALDRPSARLGHIFFLIDMDNPYKQVTSEGIVTTSDQKKIDRAISLLSEAEQPTFVHLHWMGTHGPKYYPEKQVFSKGKSVDTQGKYEDEFYYDSILDFDQHLRSLYIELDRKGLLEKTVVIISSDHTQKWSNGRIVMMMHFPGNEYAQNIGNNVQEFDIAPTLLDYLGIKQPSWMTGDSLLDGMPENRPIFTAKIPKSVKDDLTGKVTYPKSTAPFYQFGRMTVILCNTWYELHTTN
jgi:arylsulfatase A-like enzyme